MVTVINIVGGLCLVAGVVVLWTNPRRFINQIFALTSVLVAAWIWCGAQAMRVGEIFATDQTVTPVFWLKANGAIAAFLVWPLWLFRHEIASVEGEPRRAIRRSLPWLALSVILAVLSFSDWSTPSDSSPANPKRGPGFLVTHGIYLAALVWQIKSARRQIRAQSGIRRVEIQFLALNLGVALVLVIACTALGNLLHLPWLRRLGFFFFLGMFIVAAWGVSFHRIYNPREILLSLGHRLGLALLLAVGGYWIWRLLGGIAPPPVDFFISLAACGSVVFWLDRKSRDWLGLDGERELLELRQSTIAAARTESNSDSLVVAFEQILREGYRTKSAVLFFERGSAFSGSGSLEILQSSVGYKCLRESGWATPESLERQRTDTGRESLAQLMNQNSLGVIVAVPRGSRTPSLLVALGMKTNLWPFTYPEVQRLQNVAELMDNILAHSRVAAAAALKARMEHLAMMSRGLAHDLKNLITPVASFLVHTDGRFPPDSNEAEVHAAARRSVRMMTEYVREALFFAERLAPKFETVDLERIVGGVLEQTSEHASRREIRVRALSHFSGVLKADGVLLRRMLVNMVDNAIDASRRGQTVVVIASNGRPGWACVQVADEGTGIAHKNLGRVFDAYFTTKEFGQDVRGFGLGLTICRKIVDLHRGTISVKSEPGRGTAVIVELPVDQTS